MCWQRRTWTNTIAGGLTWLFLVILSAWHADDKAAGMAETIYRSDRPLGACNRLSGNQVLRKDRSRKWMMLALRGGMDEVYDYPEDDDEEEELANFTYDLPAASLQPGPLQLSWGVAEPENDAWRQEIFSQLRISESKQATLGYEPAPMPTLQSGPGQSVSSFMNAILGRLEHSPVHGDVALQVAATGMARAMQREKKKAKHEQLLREAEVAKAKEKREEEEPTREGPAVSERAWLEQWHGPEFPYAEGRREGWADVATSGGVDARAGAEEEAASRRQARRVLARGVALRPHDAAALCGLGALDEEEGDLAAAEDAYRQALQHSPTSGEAAGRLGELVQRRGGDLDLAEALYRRALHADPHHVPTLCSYGALLHDVHRNLTGAREMLDRALALAPSNALSLSNAAALLHSEGKPPAEVEAVLQQAIAAAPTSPLPLACLAEWLQSAWPAASEEGAAARRRAEGLYGEALALAPRHLQSLRGAAALRKARGDRTAAEMFEAALRADPGHVTTRYNYGAMLHAQGDAEGAARQYERALAVDPAHPAALANAAALHQAQGGESAKSEALLLSAAQAVATALAAPDDGPDRSAAAALRRAQALRHGADVWCALGKALEGKAGAAPEEAARAYREALRIDSAHASALARYAALAAGKLADPRAAEALYRELVRRQAASAGAWQAYGHCLQAQGQVTDAEVAFKRALQAEPGHVPSIASYAAFLHSVKRDVGGAKLLYARALELEPTHGISLCNYGVLQEEVYGDHQTARTLYEKALQADPADPVALCHLGFLLQDALGETASAEKQFQIAVEAHPASPAVLSNMAMFQYSSRGNLDYAEKLFRRALAADPQDVGTIINYACIMEEGRQDRQTAEQLLDYAHSVNPKEAERLLQQRDDPQAGSEAQDASSDDEPNIAEIKG